ncbi:MAG: FAD-dependent monooxygenase [Sphingobium sp.]
MPICPVPGSASKASSHDPRTRDPCNRRGNRHVRRTAQDAPTAHVPVIIVGGGQGGLSLSALLKEEGIEHLILEKNRIGHSWQSERWDSFCLVTPNRQCRLPGFSYDKEYGGTGPHGFMLKDVLAPSPHEGFSGADFPYFTAFQAMIDRAEWQWFRFIDPLLVMADRQIIYRGKIDWATGSWPHFAG